MATAGARSDAKTFVSPDPSPPPPLDVDGGGLAWRSRLVASRQGPDTAPTPSWLRLGRAPFTFDPAETAAHQRDREALEGGEASRGAAPAKGGGRKGGGKGGGKGHGRRR
mmetsp:Transcript_12117/g.38604  ORF Transcript_12117/g.38604 Transcript_12117/m.38604 type:complete len:110 (-) Transcript_12117:120-449(-)